MEVSFGKPTKYLILILLLVLPIVVIYQFWYSDSCKEWKMFGQSMGNMENFEFHEISFFSEPVTKTVYEGAKVSKIPKVPMYESLILFGDTSLQYVEVYDNKLNVSPYRVFLFDDIFAAMYLPDNYWESAMNSVLDRGKIISFECGVSHPEARAMLINFAIAPAYVLFHSTARSTKILLDENDSIIVGVSELELKKGTRLFWGMVLQKHSEKFYKIKFKSSSKEDLIESIVKTISTHKEKGSI